MTLGDILEFGYGIDLNTLDFSTIKGEDTCTKEEIIKSIRENDLLIEVFDDKEGTLNYGINDIDILDDEASTMVYIY